MTKILPSESLAPPPPRRAEERPPLLSVVCPAYGEEDCLAEFHRRVRKVMTDLEQPFETVFVNDGSTDATLTIMRALRDRHDDVAIVDLSRNYGKEIALTAGLDAARGDAIVVIDADLQDPPELIGEMIAGWAQGYDVVYATRRARAGESWLKKATAAGFYRLAERFAQVPIPRDTGDFRLMSRAAVDAVCSLRERHRFMKGLFAWAGFPAMQVYYDRDARTAGETKWNYAGLIGLAVEGLTASTTAPLRLATYLGFGVAGLSVAAGVFYAAKAVMFGEAVSGFPTLITAMLFLGGIQLMVLGVIGEYLGRVFNETKDRPLYFTRETLASRTSGAGASSDWDGHVGARGMIEEAERRLAVLR